MRIACSNACVWRWNCACASSMRLRSRPIQTAMLSATPAERAIHGIDERSAPAVSPKLVARHHIVLGQIHPDEIRCEVKHQRGIDFVAVHRLGLSFQ